MGPVQIGTTDHETEEGVESPDNPKGTCVDDLYQRDKAEQTDGIGKADGCDERCPGKC